jgi:hypothetical protein
MGAYKRVKRMGVGFLNWLEIGLGGRFARMSINRKLHSRYLRGTAAMNKDFKKEVRAYWKPYTTRFDLNWQHFYAEHTGLKDPRFIPDDLYFTTMDRHFNRRDMARGLKDKNYTPLLFPEIKQPKAILRKMNGEWMDEAYVLLTPEEASRQAARHQQLIIKPTILSGGGSGIRFWKAKDGPEVLTEIFQTMGPDLVVQELIEQHENLNRMHDQSINTVRVMSFVDQGSVRILSSVLRMGIDGNRVDNAHAGGISAGILPDGRLKPLAFTENGQRYDCHPQGARFEDCIIPNFQELLSLIVSMHGKLSHFRLLSWDIAIGKDGEPILVETNLYNGAIDLMQLNNGPLFGQETERVLEEVFGK